MGRLPRVTAEEVIRVLECMRFCLVRHGGNCYTYNGIIQMVPEAVRLRFLFSSVDYGVFCEAVDFGWIT